MKYRVLDSRKIESVAQMETILNQMDGDGYKFLTVIDGNKMIFEKVDDERVKPIHNY